MATSPYESDRDGNRAVALIEPLAESAADRSPMILETYAASLAEAGNFEKAIEIQLSAKKLFDDRLSEDNYSPEQRNGLTVRLELFKRKKHFELPKWETFRSHHSNCNDDVCVRNTSSGSNKLRPQ